MAECPFCGGQCEFLTWIQYENETKKAFYRCLKCGETFERDEHDET